MGVKKDKTMFIMFVFSSLFVILYCLYGNDKYILPVYIFYFFEIILYFVLKAKKYFKFFFPILTLCLKILCLKIFELAFFSNEPDPRDGTIMAAIILCFVIYLWWTFPITLLIGLNLDKKESNKLNIRNNNPNYEAVFGFVISLLFFLPFSGIISIILSIIGINKAKKCNDKGRKFAIVGIIMGLIKILITLGLSLNDYMH